MVPTLLIPSCLFCLHVASQVLFICSHEPLSNIFHLSHFMPTLNAPVIKRTFPLQRGQFFSSRTILMITQDTNAQTFSFLLLLLPNRYSPQYLQPNKLGYSQFEVNSLNANKSNAIFPSITDNLKQIKCKKQKTRS